MTRLKIGFMDTKVLNPNRYIVNSIYRAACSEADNFDFEIMFCTYSDVVENVKARKIDFLILLDGSALNSNFFEHLSKYVPILVWTFDDPYDLENTLQCIDFVTHFYTNDYGSLQYYKEKTSYLPLAVDETIWTPNGIEQEYKYDFSFIGTAWPNRIRTLGQISSHLKNRKKFICLPNIIGLPPDFKLESIDNFIKSRIPVTQVREISSRSKVNLIMGRDFSLNTTYPSVSKGLQPRLFETILTGQKIWIDEITYQASNLEENKFYLDIPQELSELDIVMNENLKSIISKLKEQVLKKNTYRNRVLEIFRDIKKLSSVTNNSNMKQTVTRSKAKILIVNNLDYNSINSGGSNFYALEFEKSLKELDYDIHSLFLSQDRRTVELKLGESIKKVNLSRVRDMTQFDNEEVERIFTGYLFQYDYDLIIFNHLIGLPLTLPSLAKVIGKKCVYVAHDWYLLCDIHNLYTNFAGYCGFLEKSDLDCDSCLRQQFDYKKGSKKIREKVINELVKSIDSFVVPSEFSKKSLINKLKLEIDDIHVIRPYSSPFVKNNGFSTKILKRSLSLSVLLPCIKGFKDSLNCVTK
jgi:spore maturation protein CgeB